MQENLWSGVYGHEDVLSKLEKLIQNRKIPHSFLFYGPKGVGKEFVAIKFAHILNNNFNTHTLNSLYLKYVFPLPTGKNESSDDDPFKNLSSQEIELIKNEVEKKNSNPYYEISVPKANDIKISSVRDLSHFLSMSYDEYAYKAIIISDAAKMNEPAQNALLKNLEEPPKGFVFILITSDISKLRETILSRCWKMKFGHLQADNVKSILQQYYEFNDEESDFLKFISEGSVSRAVELSKYNLNILKDLTIGFLRLIFAGKINSANQFIKENDLIEDKKTFVIFIRIICFWIEDFEKFRAGYPNLVLNETQTYAKFLEKYPYVTFNGVIRRLEEFIYMIENYNLGENVLILNLLVLLASVIRTDARIPVEQLLE
ncbi:MAG: hypothetical protein IAE91_05375 [Ignavibacteriaceae bacterium]|nr:hypothetical protein [Ignavibacteriaceae bacterium]